MLRTPGAAADPQPPGRVDMGAHRVACALVHVAVLYKWCCGARVTYLATIMPTPAWSLALSRPSLNVSTWARGGDRDEGAGRGINREEEATLRTSRHGCSAPAWPSQHLRRVCLSMFACTCPQGPSAVRAQFRALTFVEPLRSKRAPRPHPTRPVPDAHASRLMPIRGNSRKILASTP